MADPNTEQTATADAQPVTDDDGLGDFGLDDGPDLDAIEEPVAGPVADAPAEGGGSAPVEGVEQAAGDATEQPAEPETITIDGNKIPLAGLPLEQVALLKKASTHYGQVSHYQKLADERAAEVERVKAEQAEMSNNVSRIMAERMAREQADQAQPVGPTPEFNKQLTEHYKPEIDRLVESGAVSKFVAEEDPGLLAHGLYLRDELYQTKQTVEILKNYIVGTHAQNMRQSAEGQINDLFDSYAERGDIYAPLSDVETRQKFFQTYASLANPMEMVKNPELFERLWIGFVRDEVLAAAGRAKEIEEQRQNEQRRRTTGEGVGLPPTTPAVAANPFGLDDMEP